MDTDLKRKTIITAIFSIAAVGIAGFLFFWVFIFQPSPKTKVERWLGVQLPNSVSEVRYYYEQAPGSYQASLIARLEVPQADFISLMRNSGFNKAAETSLVQKLPTDFNTDPQVRWWTPPDDQSDRLFLNTNYAETICIWHSEFAYFEKNGGFGSMWNRKVVQSN